MNKLSIGLLLAASLFVIDVTPAAAHQGAHKTDLQRYGYHYDTRRRHEMPRWLQRNRHFRHWYRNTPLRHYRQIRWHQLYEIYRWERRYFVSRHYVDRDHDRHRPGDRRRYRDDD